MVDVDVAVKFTYPPTLRQELKEFSQVIRSKVRETETDKLLAAKIHVMVNAVIDES